MSTAVGLGQLGLFDSCQRWRQHRSLYRPAGEPIDTSRYGVAPIEESAAKAFVQAHHYSGSYPAAVYRVGLFFKPALQAEQLAGVAVFSVPCTPAVITRYLGLAPGQGVELGRFVLLDDVPANGESWFFARARRLLFAHKGYRGIVAYCDPVERRSLEGTLVKPGHVGTIYKASGFRAAGRARPRTLWLDPAGQVVSERALSKISQEDTGIGYALRQLQALGAPALQAAESGAAYVRRVKQEGVLRPMRHPGNLVFTWQETA